MENLSNNKLTLAPLSLGEGLGVRSHNTRNSLRLFLVLFHFSFFIFHFSFLKAQNAYNKLYTLQAHASTMDAIAPHGSLGGCMVAATAVDSSTGKQAIRIVRIDAMGNLQASNYFNIPDDTTRSIYVNYKAITRVHDNCYAMVGTVLPKVKQYSFILLADSNGVVFKYKDVPFSDSSNYLSDVKYDGFGNLIAGGTNRIGSVGNIMICKFDTALNEIWIKSYHPSALLIDQLTQNLSIDNSGYLLCGGGQGTGLPTSKGYKCQAFLFKIDTAGIEQWFWASSAIFYSDYQSHIGSALNTKDGGYLFTTEGHTYNRYPSSAPVIQLEAKQLIIKLDAARNKQWEIVVDDYFHAFGYVPRTYLIELEDSSFIYAGFRNTDSIDYLTKVGSHVLQQYSKDGKLLKQRIVHHPPKELGDITVTGGPYYDIKQMPDKSFILCGYYENKTTGAPAPAQRGWLLKLDSNLCLGVGDSQCMASSIIEQPQVSGAGFKVYPNPSTGYITLTSLRDKHGLRPKVKQSETINTKVFDLLGRIVHQQKLSFNNNEAILNLNLPSATYILEMNDEAGTLQRERLVIQ